MKKSVHVSSPEAAFARSGIGQRLTAMQDAGSRSNRAIAHYILRNPVLVTAWSIEDLSAAVSVSTATLSRFARLAGFAGYPDLRGAIAETLQSILKPVEKLRDAIEKPRADGAPFPEGLQETVDAVRTAAAALDGDSLSAVVRQVQGARTVYVMGFGLSAHLAGILTLGLQPFCPQLINVVEFGGTEVAAGRLMNVGGGDLLIVISFPRYASDAVQLAAYARNRGAEVLAITDSPASPLSRVAHRVLLASSAHPILSSSLAAAVLVIEALLTAMMTSSRENVVAAAKLTEAISAYLVRSDGESAQEPASRKAKGPG
jgi:DNA-binding MurR/RpiR family transcriptional regulator